MIHTLALLAAVFSPACPPDGIDTTTLYRVLPGPRVPFHRTPDCADVGCSEGRYVVAGDRVVVYARSGGRSCAMFARTRETIGWVDTDRLTPDTAATRPAPASWIGDWYDGDDHIRLTMAGPGRLKVDGDAYWPAANPVGRESGPHIGNLDGIARIDGDRLDYSDGTESYDCRATLRLLGDYLLADDNSNCGGMNVRFRGTYRRRSAHRPATRS